MIIKDCVRRKILYIMYVLYSMYSVEYISLIYREIIHRENTIVET